jgi:KipI family sensor histidine kinase inhibitor
VDGLDEVLALHAEIGRRRAAGWAPSLVEVVPAARTVLLDGVDDPAAVAREIRSWAVPPAPAEEGPVVEIRCVYDGPDLGDVAARWGLAPAEVAAQHASVLHRVAFCGFGPGFAYLTGIGEDRAVPRRPHPRTTVPAGSVAVAGSYTGVYPRASPGGWNLIGRTDAAMWDAARPEPALLQPGWRVRFVEVAGDALRPSPAAG